MLKVTSRTKPIWTALILACLMYQAAACAIELVYFETSIDWPLKYLTVAMLVIAVLEVLEACACCSFWPSIDGCIWRERNANTRAEMGIEAMMTSVKDQL